MALEPHDFMQMSPIFISVFMLMTSLFNGDVKGLVWLACAILGVLGTAYLGPKFTGNYVCPTANINTKMQGGQKGGGRQPIIDIFSKYPNLSVSTFFIMFTLTYLILPMQQNNDWNYYIIVGFLGLFAVDTLIKLKEFCTTQLGIFTGTVIGCIFSLLCYFIIRKAGGDNFLYFNSISSNNVYCSKPKKQQFKCFVYKNGEIISAV